MAPSEVFHSFHISTAPKEMRTIKECRQWLTQQGYRVQEFQTAEGREYLVTNFRGGQCFRGSGQELLQQIKTWPVAA